MSVIAFVDGSQWDVSVVEHAAWAATSIGQALTFVAHDGSLDSEPVIAYDAYQQMDVREDVFRELAARNRSRLVEGDSAARETVQMAARVAKQLGVEKIRTTTTSDSLPYFIENFTDSEDLLVVARHDDNDSSRQWLDQFLKLRSRVMLLVPDTHSKLESWLIAIDGKPAIGRAVDFLTRHDLLRKLPGTAVFVGDDYHNRLHFRDAVKHLQSARHTVEAHELQGQADDVLAAVLAISPVDMLVMGAYGQGRFRQLTERSTTSRLLKTFAGPILVARE